MKYHSDLRIFLENSILTFLQQSIALILGFSISIILARTLGKEGIGVVTLVLLFPMLIVVFLNWGTPASTVYLLGGKKYQLEETVFNNLIISLLQSVIGLLVAAAVLLFLKDRLFEGIDSIFLYLILPIIPLRILNLNLRAIFHAISDFRALNIIVAAPFFWTVVFLVILIFLHQLTIFNTLIAYVFAEFATLCGILLFFHRHNISHSVKIRLNDIYLKDSLRYGIRIYIASIFNFLNYRQDRFLLNFFQSPASVGIYNVGASLGEKLWTVSQSVSTVLFPKIASLEENESKRQWITPFITRHVFWVTSFVAVIIYWISPSLIRILYGHEFVGSALVLQIMLPGIVFFTIGRIISNDIAGRGLPKFNMLFAGITVLVNFVANIMLIPRYGIAGAAWASTISYTLNAVIWVGMYYRLTHVSPIQIFIIRPDDLRAWRRLFVSKIS